METGRKILNLRKDRGIPQKTLATQTAVTPSALSRIESGHHQPRGPVALRISRELGVTADYLLDSSVSYPPPGREILAHLVRADEDEVHDQSVPLSARERRVLEALRRIEEERLVLLEAVLDGKREDVRFASYLLGAGERIPGFDDAELEEFRERLRGQ